MGQLIVVSGPPGSGKSTVAELLAASYDPSALVAGDSFFEFLRRGAIEPWRPESQAQNDDVIKAAAAATGRLVTGDRTVVYDGVLGPWFLSTFAAAAGLTAFDVVVLMPSESRIEQQVRDRGGHGFRDLEAARHMHREFAAAEIDPRHVVTDPPRDPDETAALIRHRLQTGALRWARPC